MISPSRQLRERNQTSNRQVKPTTISQTPPSAQSILSVSPNFHLTTGTSIRAVDEAQTRFILRNCDAVCFDVDSTVCRDEAIDELAAFCGVGTQVAAWTKKAMNGNFSFRQALEERLNLIRPTKQQLDRYKKQNPPKLTPGIKELVAELHRQGKRVFLVSGGFYHIITGVANILRIPHDHIFANVLHFNNDGSYDGFDEEQPTSDSGGKGEVCAILKNKYNLQRLVMIGDGATDLEACPPADAFIGFGGNQVREKVRQDSSWFVYNFSDLIEELQRDD